MKELSYQELKCLANKLLWALHYSLDATEGEDEFEIYDEARQKLWNQPPMARRKQGDGRAEGEAG